MDEFDKLYTVDEVAQMTRLTSRTIRNYIKRGLLRGKKIGGQWRFSQSDIENLMSISTAAAKMSSANRRDVLNFIDRTGPHTAQVCAVADLQLSQGAAEKLAQKICKITSRTADEKLRFHYEYIEAEQTARFTVFGAPSFVAAVMEVLS